MHATKWVKHGVIDNAGEILQKQWADTYSQLSINADAVGDVVSDLTLQQNLQLLHNITDPNSSALLGSTLAAFTKYKNSTDDALAAILVCILSLIAIYDSDVFPLPT